MTKREVTDVMNRVRGMLMHLYALTGDETKRAVQSTLCDLGDVEDFIGLNEIHSDDPEDEDDD